MVAWLIGTLFLFCPLEKTKSLLFNGTKAVMGRLWKVDGEDKSCNGPDSETSLPNGNPTLLKGQTVIGFDGKLKRTTAAPGNTVLLLYLA